MAKQIDDTTVHGTEDNSELLKISELTDDPNFAL